MLIKRLVLAVLLCSFPLLSHAQKTLKIAVLKDYAPYSFIDNQGKPKGMLHDYWRLWAQHTNQHIEFVPSNFKQASDGLLTGEIDIIAGLYQRNKKNVSLTFSNDYYTAHGNVYIKKSLRHVVGGMSDLDGKVVGVVGHGPYSDYLAQFYPKIARKEFASYAQLLEASIGNDVEAMFGEALVMWQKLFVSGYLTDYTNISGVSTSQPIVAAVKFGNEELLDIVNQGISLISPQEKYQVQQEWIVDKDLFSDIVKLDTRENLSQEERLWLHNKERLFVGVTADWFPYSFTDSNNQPNGYHIDLLNIINHNLSINLLRRPYKVWADGLFDIKKGQLDALLGVSWTPQRSIDFSLSSAYLYRESDIIVRENSTDITGISDLSNKRIISFKHQIIDEFLDEMLPNATRVYVTGVREGLDLIKNNKADAIILSTGTGIELREPSLKVINQVFTKGAELAIASAKDNQILTSILNKGVKSISAAQKNEMRARWIDRPKAHPLYSMSQSYFLRENPSLTLFLEPDLLFISDNHIKKIAKKLSSTLAVNISIEHLNKNNPNRANQATTIKLAAVVDRSSYSGDGQLVTPQISRLALSLVTASENQVSFAQRTGLTVAVTNSLLGLATSISWLEQHNILTATSDRQGIKLLEQGKVDAVFLHSSAAALSMLDEALTIEPISVAINLVTQPNEKVLQDILSIAARQYNRYKNQQNMLSEPSASQGLRLAFIERNEPYFVLDSALRGIEFDLMQAALHSEGQAITSFEAYGPDDVLSAFDKDETIDAIVGIRPSNERYFYSDSFITFQNVAISKRSDGLLIDSIASLKGKSVGAWHDAHRHLGLEYAAMFEAKLKPASYREYQDQILQVEQLLAGHHDVIVIDRRIFSSIIDEIAPQQLEQMQFDYIFPLDKSVTVAFKNRDKRDAFNIQLDSLKRSGDYQKIVASYTNGSFKPSLELSQLIAAVLSKSLSSNDQADLQQLISFFTSFDYIKSITTIDLTRRKFGNQPMDNDTYYQSSDSIFISPRGAMKVGRVTVGFDMENLLRQIASKNHIPALTSFVTHPNYLFISQEYQRLGHTQNKLALTVAESRYIKNAAPILYSDGNWIPLIFPEGEGYAGVVPDYLALISKKTGLEFISTPSKTWPRARKKFKENSVAILPSIGKYDRIVGNKSAPYAKFNYIVIKAGTNDYINSLKELEFSTVAAVRNFNAAVHIKKYFPEIKLAPVQSIDEGLKLVSNGLADYFIGHEISVRSVIVQRFPQLKLVGVTELQYLHHMLIHDDEPLLLSIVNKAIADISFEEHQAIRHKWSQELNKEVDHTLVIKLISWFSIIIAIGALFYRQLAVKRNVIAKSNFKLSEMISDITAAKDQLTERTLQLESQKKNFESLFYDVGFNLCLLNEQRMVNCNQSFVEFFGYSCKDELISLDPGSLLPKYQPDGQPSNEYILAFDHRCLATGKSQFEITIKQRDHSLILCEVMLTRITLDGVIYTHVLVTDISDKKHLEREILARNQELERTNDELHESIEVINKTQEQLIESEKFAGLGSLVAGVAHEINTPVGIGLTGITHFQRLNKELREKYQQQKMTQTDFETFLDRTTDASTLILKNLQRTAELVNSFKQVSVDQSSEQQRDFEVHKYTHEVLLSLTSVLKRSNLNISVTGKQPLTIHSYPGLLSQLISNLVMNSNIHAFFPGEAGELTIDFSVNKQQLQLIYTDNGKGIPKSNLKKIFDPFFTTNRDNGGSGLGLNIIHNIVTKQLNGSITCSSVVGEGVTFTICYPIIQFT